MPFIGKLIILLLASLNAYFIDIEMVNFSVAVILILIFGIPHGATDHVLFNILQSGRLEQNPKQKFIFFYLLTMALFSLAWYFFPVLSLLLFLLISAYHFGETQLSYWKEKNALKPIAFLSWGIAILSIILFSDIPRLQQYLVPSLLSEDILLSVLSIKYYLFVGSLGIFLALIAIYDRYKILGELFDLGVITLLSIVCPLLLSFALFFAFWHSKDAIILQINSLKLSSNSFSIRQWIKLALPFSILSIVGIVMIIGVTQFFEFEIPLVTLLFILIAIITLPHALIMSRYLSKN
ncbi:MAG: Brp/Blh family beta-carotene 15,15'-monooxygenase [Cyclobacteriaceae bacterium]|jgi:Brp/Blh family beta-carotene 15,15'-monooxygenase